jgi:exonuclease SbcD
MSDFRFLHVADLHIDSPLRGLEAEAPAERIRGATRAAYTNLVNLALNEQVAFVVIAGDLFDGDWQDWRTGQFFAQETARLTRAGIRVVAIRGNHDAECVITRHLALPDGARLLRADRPESVRIAEHNVCIHGQSFARREVTTNLAADYPPPLAGHFNIGLLHTAAGGRPGHAAYAPCSVGQLVAHGYDYWALGHVHTREVLAQGDCWVVFPGNTQGRHINEPGAKGATLVTVRDRHVADAVHCPLDVVRWADVRVSLDGIGDEEQALAAVRAALGAALVEADGRLLAARLVLEGASPLHPALVRDLGATHDKLWAEAMACAATGELWLECAQLRTRPALDRAALRTRADALGRLVRAIEAADPARFADAAKSYSAALLDRARGLRETLGPDHAAVQAARGALPAELLERAKDLLLARLAED